MISSRPVRSAIVGFGKDSGADADGGAGAAMLHIDDDASSEASEDGRVVAYREKFCGEQVNFHSKRVHRRRRNRRVWCFTARGVTLCACNSPLLQAARGRRRLMS